MPGVPSAILLLNPSTMPPKRSIALGSSLVTRLSNALKIGAITPGNAPIRPATKLIAARIKEGAKSMIIFINCGVICISALGSALNTSLIFGVTFLARVPKLVVNSLISGPTACLGSAKPVKRLSHDAFVIFIAPSMVFIASSPVVPVIPSLP